MQCLRHVTLCLSTYHRTVEHMCNKPQPISAQMFHTCKNRKTSWSNWEFCTLLTHCRSKRYRTLLLHITYQEVLKKKKKKISQAVHGWMSEQWCTQSVGPSLIIKISHCYSETHHSDLIRTGWDIHGRVKRNVSCRPFTETQTKHQKPEPLPPILFQAYTKISCLNSR